MPWKVLVLFFAAAGLLDAQDPPSLAGRLSYINGPVSFEPAGLTDWGPATLNRPLTIGDQLYTDTGARAEIEVPGAAFQLSSQTAFQFLNLDDHNIQARLSEGTLSLRVRRLEGGENLEVDTPNLAFSINRPGEYRIDTSPDTYETRVTAWDGNGSITANGAAFPVEAGQEAVVSGQNEVQYSVYAAPEPDAFDNWALSRDRREARADRYVSPYMVGYADLDEYGSWRYVPEYGEAWVPYNLPVGWAPYQYGQWTWVDPWGWTWVDADAWGFAPFHYGRWAFAAGSWCWLPGPVAVTPVYAPALVAWVGFGHGFGLSLGFGGGPAVGWFPLGPRDVYVPAYSASEAYVTRINTTNTTVVNNTTITNVYNNYVRTGTVAAAANSVNRSVPGAVVAVPQNALRSARPVRQVARKLSTNQIRTIQAVDPAPHVAPQMASVLGHAPATGVMPHPSTAVLRRPVVAKTTPPAPAVPFQRRQALLARNPGHPLRIQQQQQLARIFSQATRPPVQVVTRAPRVAPQVSRGRAPRFIATTPGTVARRQPVQAPPTAARQAQPVPPQQSSPRPFEPPAVQRHQAPAAQANVRPSRPANVPPSQTSARRQARPYQPPQAQQQPRHIPQAAQARSYQPPQARNAERRPYQPPVQARRVAPPAPQRTITRPYEAPPAQTRQYQPPVQARRVAPPTPQPTITRPNEAPRPQARQYQPPVEERRATPPPRIQEARPPVVARQARPPSNEKQRREQQ